MKNLNIVFIVIVSLFLSISCSKKDSNSPQLNNLKSVVENPMDFIGVAHNEALDFVSEDAEWPDLTQEEIIERLADFDYDDFPLMDGDYEQYLEDEEVVYELLEETDSITFFLIRDSIISSETGGLMDSLISILSYYLDTSLTTPYSISSFNSSIQDFVDYLDASYDFPTSSLEEDSPIALLLGSAAIAKSSYSYWHNAYSEEDDPWHFFFENSNKSTNEQNSGIGRFFKKVWHDTTGFVASGCGYWMYEYVNGVEILVRHYPLGCAWKNAGEESAAVN